MQINDKTAAFINAAKIKHNDKYQYTNTNYTNSKSKVIITCKTHGDFYQTPDKHLQLRGCPKCGRDDVSRKLRNPLEHVLNLFKKTHNGVYDYSGIKYTSLRRKIGIKCPVHGIFYQIAGHHANGSGCPKCVKAAVTDLRRYNVDTFIKMAKDVHGDTYDYSEVVYVNSLTPVKIGCPVHGFYMQYPHNHYTGSGCHLCNGLTNSDRQRGTVDEFISKAIKKHGDSYIYDKVVYVNNKIPVIVVCKKHGQFNVRPDQHLYNLTGCPVCETSKGELKIWLFLKAMNIAFIREYRLPESMFRYDFYLPVLNLLIEYDGKQHFNSTNIWNGVSGLRERMARDAEKDKLARVNKIPLIRLAYTEYSILEHKLLIELCKHYKYTNNGIFYKSCALVSKLKQSNREQYLLTYKVFESLIP